MAKYRLSPFLLRQDQVSALHFAYTLLFATFFSLQRHCTSKVHRNTFGAVLQFNFSIVTYAQPMV